MVSTKSAVDATVSRFLKDVQVLMRQAVKQRVEEAVKAARHETRGRGRKAVTRAPQPRAAQPRAKQLDLPFDSNTHETEELADRLLDYIENNPSQGIHEIAAALGTESALLERPLGILLLEDHLVTEGEGANVVYIAR